jgi:hypothetical protein
MSQLRDQYYKEVGCTWINGDGEPDIDYVYWLETKLEKQDKCSCEVYNVCEVMGDIAIDKSCPFHGSLLDTPSDILKF